MLTIPDRLPFHFRREHLPTGRVWYGEFNGTHSLALRCPGWENMSTRSLVSEINRVVESWNRQQATTWRYTAVVGACPGDSERAPDGSII